MVQGVGKTRSKRKMSYMYANRKLQRYENTKHSRGS